MQAACPQCAHKIAVDDARVPDRPFAVKCPKCQASVRFPGKAAAPAAGQAAAAAPPPPAAARPAPADGAGEETYAPAPPRREAAPGSAGHGRKVLVGVSDRGIAAALAQPLTRVGYAAEALDAQNEGDRMLEDGVFDVVVAHRAAAGPGSSEPLYERVTRLAPAARRRIFLVLVGDEYTTGDGLQAFAAQADFVVNPRDAAGVEAPLLKSMTDRGRLYQVYLDARRAAGND